MKIVSLSLLSALAFAALALANPHSADARVRVKVGGGVKVHGHVGVYVGPPVYTSTTYGPAPAYYPADPYYPPPPPPVYVAPRRPIFGLGLYASSVAVDTGNDSAEEGSGGGLFARLRLSNRFELEGEIGGEAYMDSARLDSRLGIAGIINLGEPGGFTPYLVLGTGLAVVSPQGQEREEDPDTLPSYGYVEAGIGLSWELTPHFQLTGDLRLQSRHLAETEGSARTLPAYPGAPDEESVTLGRIAAIYYF
jgi:hypothetical protein